MMKCGLLGEVLGHSYSPQIHSCLGNYEYDLYEIPKEQLEDFLTGGDFAGLNVTIPYKQAVIPYCAELSPRAKALGAVNTLVRRKDGSLMGHNTDFFGFETMLRSRGISVSGKKVLVLGSGGASKTVASVLEQQGAQVVVVSRSGENHYGNLDLHKDAAVIVNTTPVGMYPNTGISPVDLSAFLKLEGVLDVIYNPARTQLLLDAENLGIPYINGLLMLVAQAAESAVWFTGAPVAEDAIPRIYRKLNLQMQNIILIGMPGSGKSTVGKLLAQMTGKTFIDADALIVEKAGMSIPEIFEKEGESGFRLRETQILQELGCRSGLVIATGGGCVTKEENYPLLHQNGRIFYLERALSRLATKGRPLSKNGKLQDMYHTRLPMYRRFADHFVDNNGKAQDTAGEILKIWEEMQ